VRAGTVIDNLLPLLAEADTFVTVAAAKTLSAIPPGPRAGTVISKLMPLLEYNDRVREAAADALAVMPPSEYSDTEIGKLLTLLVNHNYVAARLLTAIGKGGRAGTVIDKLLPLLDDRDSGVRLAAAEVLAAIPIGERANTVIDKLLPHLAETKAPPRVEAAYVLAGIPLGERAGTVIDKLLAFLDDRDPIIIMAGADALARVPPGDRADVIIDKLLLLLAERQETRITFYSARTVRSAVARALTAIPRGGRARAVVEGLFFLSVDGIVSERRAAADALAAVPPAELVGVVDIDRLVRVLADGDPEVRNTTAQTLAGIGKGPHADIVIDRLLPLLIDPVSSVRSAAAQAVAAIVPSGEAVSIVVDKLLPFLTAGDPAVRSAAAQALASGGKGARVDTIINKLLPLLVDRDSGVNRAGFLALRQIGPGGISTSLEAIKLIHDGDASAIGPLRAATHIAIGADEKTQQAETMLAWLGKPSIPPLVTIADDPAGAYKVLALILEHWSELLAIASIRREAEEAVMNIIYAACHTSPEVNTVTDFLAAAGAWLRNLPLSGPLHQCWSAAQKSTVEGLLDKFKEQKSTFARPLADHLARENIAPIGKWLTWSLVGWMCVWVAFLVAFPWSPTVQAIFFWNPRVREMFSLWFVPLLLLVFPFLRRRLLQPFHDDLIGAARPDDFSRLGFFREARARLGDGPPALVDAALAGLHGTIVIRGEAGVGKTSALRWLALTTHRPVAFLHAR
jgi:HEAT repeat protein